MFGKEQILHSVKLCFLESPSFRHFYIRTSYVEKNCAAGALSLQFDSLSHEICYKLIELKKVKKNQKKSEKPIFSR